MSEDEIGKREFFLEIGALKLDGALTGQKLGIARGGVGSAGSIRLLSRIGVLGDTVVMLVVPTSQLDAEIKTAIGIWDLKPPTSNTMSAPTQPASHPSFFVSS